MMKMYRPANLPRMKFWLAIALSVLSLTPAFGASGSRTLRVRDGVLQPSQSGVIIVQLEAQGDEAAIGFTLNFDPARLQFSEAVLGTGAAGATLFVNANQAGNGQVGILLGMQPPTGVFQAGTRELVRVTVIPRPTTGSTTVSFGDAPVFREIVGLGANTLATTFAPGTITINTPPVANAQGVSVVEDQSQPITLTANDTDGQSLTYTVVGTPSKGTLTGAPPNFTYVPQANQNGSDSFSFKVNDGLVDSTLATVTLAIAAVNDPPFLTSISNQTISEGSSLSVTATASDIDTTSSSLTFSLASNAPSGASINSATGILNWTPSESQGPGSFNITVIVNDNGSPNLSDSKSFTVSVSEVNQLPSLASIGSQTIAEGSPLTLTASGSDPDLPSNTLTYSLGPGAPAGASINPSTGAFNWTPTEAQGPGSFTISIQVADNGSPSLTATQGFQVTVNESNSAPTLGPVSDQTVNEGQTITASLTATDTDLPANTLTFSLDSGAPAGASINPSTGAFNWVPTEAQGPGDYTITARVTDNGSPSQTATRSFKITVNEVNAPPVLAAIADRTVSEGSPLSVSMSATDPDQPANTLNFRLGSGAPTGVAIDSTTGTVTWIPSENQGPGDYTITVLVADNISPSTTSSQSFKVTVTEVNAAPTLAAIPNQTIRAGTPLAVTASATDPDLPANTLAFSLEGAPSGASINPATGALSWTPPFSAETTTHSFTVRVTDSGTQGASDTKSFTVTVTPSNRPPVLPAFSNQTVNEGSPLTSGLAATDPDQPPNKLAYKLGGSVPSGMSVDPTSGQLSWTPNETQGPSTNSITVQVTDDGSPPLTAEKSVLVIVNEVNSPPVLGTIGNQTIRAGDPLNVTISATDPDLPANAIAFNLGAGAPAGASINPSTGAFSWTPALTQGASTNVIAVTAADNGSPSLSDTKSFTVVVTPANTAPVLAPISDLTVNEGGALNLTITAQDADLPPNQLTYSLGPTPPAGLSIDPNTGVLAWIPTEAQGPSTNRFSVRVIDNGIPPMSAEQNAVVVVTEVNSPPNIGPISNQTVREGQSLAFSASATDPDLPPNAIRFSLGPNAPVGAALDPATGALAWTPTEFQGPSTNVITIVATDNGSPNLSTNRAVIVVVTEDNAAPALNPISPQTVNEGSPISFTATGTDPDFPAQTLAFSLAPGAPAGASINPATGVFSWPTAEAQGPSTNSIRVRVTDNAVPPLSAEQDVVLVVNEVNSPPALGPLANQRVKEGDTLTFTAAATDPDLPANVIQYSLGPGAPSGATINPATGVFTWIPTAAQTPSTNSITVTATDNATPPLSVSQTLQVIVFGENRPPVLTAIPAQTVPEGGTLTFTATATDLDVPAQTLTFSLGPAAPAGASINPTTGVFSWTPTEIQGPTTNVVVVRVTDSGTVPQRAAQDVTIIVTEVNAAPVLQAVNDQTIGAGDTLNLRVTASDADAPRNLLTFSLEPGAPAGAGINPTNGVVTWTPTPAQASSTNQVAVRVTDNGSPALSDTKSFAIVVRAGINQPPSISSISSQTTRENTPTGATVFTISDPDTPIANLALIASSSNTNLVPVSNISFGGSGTNRTVTIIPALNQNGTANITVTVQENTGGKASTSFDVVVTPVAPAITRQPQNLELVVGNPANFSVSATGSQPLSYQWRFKGTPISGATNSSLALPSAQETDEGVYTVEIKNSIGAIVSADAKLTANLPLRINLQPISQSVLAGANVTFVVTASGRGPLAYAWRLNGSGLGVSTPSLVMQNVDATKAGDYDAVISNASGSVTSVVAKLEVKVPVLITRQPQSQSVPQGTNVAFSVQASGTPPLAYQWQLNGVDLAGQTNTTLSVSSVSSANAGDYSVTVSNPGGAVTSARASLIVSLPPTITRPPQSQEAVAGANVQFNVTVSGTEPLSYQWRLNGNPLSGQTGPVLSLPNVQVLSAGDYSVVVSNAAGSVTSAAANLKITGPVTIALQPQSQTVNVGESVAFNVVVTGTGPKYQWRFNGVDIPGATQFQLNLDNVKPENAGSYAVVVSNPAGAVTSVAATLRVNVPVTITLQPQSQTANSGSSVVFTVAAVGASPLSYQWRFNGADLPGQTGAALALSNVQRSSHAGSYSVVVRNMVGPVTSATANLTVLVPPSIQAHPSSQNVPLGANVSFSVSASGDAPLTYQWQKNGNNIPGATSASLNFPNAQAADAGSYSVVVQNPGGTLTSDSANLTVILPPLTSGSSAQSAPPPIESAEGSFDGGSNALGGALLVRKNAPATAQERWFSWKAPSNGIVTFSTAGSTFDTEMAVYTGASPNLTEIGSDDDRGGFLSSEIRFNAVQGTTYLIKVKGFEGATGRIVVSFKLQNTTLKLPVIRTSPLSQTVAAGGEATFTVVAEGTDLTYQWHANDTPLANQTSPRLVLSNVQEANAARYTVRITTNTGGVPMTIESLPAILQIGPPNTAAQDKFKSSPRLGSSTQPLSNLARPPIKNSGASLARGYSGSQVFSTFGAAKEPGEPNHADVVGGASQWFTYQAPSTGVLRVSTEGSNFDTLLAIYTGPGTDFESLKVVASDNNSGKDGLTSVTSFPVTVGTVYYIAVDGVKGATGNAKLSYEFGLAPVISQQPASQAVLVGANVTVSVETANPLSGATTNVPALSYQWIRGGLKIAGETKSSLTLLNVQQASVGDYAVIVSNLAGSATSAVAQITVTVPVVITGQPQNQTGKTGSRISFNVVANGTPPILYQWLFNGVDLNGATNATLVHNAIQLTDAGSYSVVVSNAKGSVQVQSREAVLSITQVPKITTQPVDQMVVAGSPVTFSVIAEGTPPLAYQWRLNGVNLAGPEATQPILALSSVAPGSAGEYTVVVSNSADSIVSVPARLSVNIPLTLTSLPQSQRVSAGSSAVFSVTANGTGPFNYQWWLNGTEFAGATNANLVLSNVQTNHAGAYAVSVGSPAGSLLSPPATLSVNEAPVITQQPISQVVFMGSAATLTVVAAGSQPLSYQWFLNGSPIDAATNSELVLTNLSLANAGNYSVSVSNLAGSVVSDLALLTLLQIVSEVQLNNGVFQFQLTVPAGNRARVQFSADLVTWDDLLPNPVSSGTATIQDPQALNFELRYYRVILEPQP